MVTSSRGGGGANVSAVSQPTTYSTSFPATEDPLSEGGSWTQGKAVGVDWNNVKSAGGLAGATHAMATPPPYDDCIAHVSLAAFSAEANQYAQGTVFRTPGYTTGHEIELLVRFSISANVARGYEVYWSTNGGIYIVRWNGSVNDFNSLVTAQPGLANSGDVVRVEAVGSTITVKINGSTVLSVDDTTWAAGQPGIGLNPYGAGYDFFGYTWSDFACGNL